jgi:pilus assembly protein CpaE
MNHMTEITQPQERPETGELSRHSRTPSGATIVLICPNEMHRRTLARTFEAQHVVTAAELVLYPTYNHLLSVIDVECDAFVVEIDTDTDAALDVVETICARRPAATVMVYSAANQPDLLVRSMRAGAREFLAGTVPSAVLSEALLRASARRAELATKRTRGKVLLFWGAKGGSGVTTLVTNFALALRQEAGSAVALVDLNTQLGDVAVLLGVTPRFTIADALLNPDRLDEEFVATLATQHRSGVSIIAAPDTYSSSRPIEAKIVGRLVDLLASQFPYVVLDAGPGLGNSAEPLFQLASTIYVVTQVDIPSLRNSQRFLSYLQGFGHPRVELVLNRYESRQSGFDDERLSKAVGVQPKWKVPNDYEAVRRASDTGTPLAENKSAITAVLRDMARNACGRPAEPEKRRGFSLFRQLA